MKRENRRMKKGRMRRIIGKSGSQSAQRVRNKDNNKEEAV